MAPYSVIVFGVVGWTIAVSGAKQSTLVRFQTKTELFCSVLKKICVHAREKPHGSVRAPFWILTVEWSGARSGLFR